ncbi:TPA: dTMP kinase [Candidatus Galligastranaerophilus intestinigallinarum]|nr:dTMP kinase [Candidatus Galligastranaerophilus intestinigallinarum]
MARGVFITFEGADGCGKTTQIELLKKYLDEKNIKNIQTREPGATELGVELRKILLHYEKPVSDVAETFLYLADRAQHTEFEIKPMLDDGYIILCDRFIDSTVSYQGYARKQDINQINKLNEIATGGLKPDLTIVFDIESTIAQKRLQGEKDRLEKEGLEFHKALRFGYLELAKKEPDRIKVINADDTIENIHKKVIELISRYI